MDKQKIIASLYETIGNIETMTDEEFAEKINEVNAEYEKVRATLIPDDPCPYGPDSRPVFPKASCRNKRARLLAARHKLRKLYDKTKHIYGVGAYYDTRKKRIIKDSINSSSERAACNRRFRRRWNNGRYDAVANGGAYRKHEEYWWSVL